MPNRRVHTRAEAVAGGSYALYMSYGRPAWYVVVETAGGIVGGIVGGVIPDGIDTPSSRWHRAEAGSGIEFPSEGFCCRAENRILVSLSHAWNRLWPQVGISLLSLELDLDGEERRVLQDTGLSIGRFRIQN
jgi:hypothetical protein